MTLPHRLTTIVLLLMVLAAAAVSVNPAQPAAAAELSASRYLVVEVPGEVVDDYVGIERGDSQSAWIGFNLPAKFAAALCKYFDNWECICVGVHPDLCKDPLASYLPGFPDLDLSFKYCGDYQCLCIDVEPEECVPDRAQVQPDRISLRSPQMPAVLDLAARELKSGKYSAVKICSPPQQGYAAACLTARRP
jgi:hypothetical protein